MANTPAKTRSRRATEKRRQNQRKIDRQNEERNRRKSIGGGKPNELGVIQGQSGEQGSTVTRRNIREQKIEH